MSDLTQLLNDVAKGDLQSAEKLLPVVYDELRRLAAAKLRKEAAGITLQPTALVHEAYLRLLGRDPEKPWDGRRHFFGAAAEAMRRILIESARRRKSLKRGGDRTREDIEVDAILAPEPDDDLLALDDALTRLAEHDPVKAELVRLKHFAGLTIEQAGEALDLSRATAERYWAYAKAWLHQEIKKSLDHGENP